MKESGDDVMLSDASPVSPAQGLESPIATALINARGDGDIFVRFVRFPSEGVVDLVERCQGHSTQRLSVCRPLPKCLLVQLETTGRSSWST